MNKFQYQNKAYSVSQFYTIPNVNALYIPYGYLYKDFGWGCAWRSIQMILNSSQDFQKLYDFYKHKKNLMKIAQKMVLSSKLTQESYEQLQDRKFSPQQNKGWAQPLIGHLILFDKGIQSKLFLLNGYPINAAAPSTIFKQISNYHQFKTIAKQNLNKSPIMLDDGIIAIVLFAIQQKGQFTMWLIGDPHIRNNTSHKKAGLYWIEVDSNGKQIKAIIQKQEYQQLYLKTAQKITFVKNWMVLLHQ